jgi:hypothetical protein
MLKAFPVFLIAYPLWDKNFSYCSAWLPDNSCEVLGNCPLTIIHGLLLRMTDGDFHTTLQEAVS